jgi:hypothetical protein
MAINYRDLLSKREQERLKGRSNPQSDQYPGVFSQGLYSLFDSLAQKYGFSGNGQQYLDFVFQSLSSPETEKTVQIPEEVKKTVQGIIKQAVVNNIINTKQNPLNTVKGGSVPGVSAPFGGRLYAQPKSVPIPQSMQVNLQPDSVPIPKETIDFDNMTVKQANDLLFGREGYFTKRGYNTTGSGILAQESQQPRIGGKNIAQQPMALKPSASLGQYYNVLQEVQAKQPGSASAVKNPVTPPKKQEKPGDFIKSLQSNVRNIQSVVGSWFGKKK